MTAQVSAPGRPDVAVALDALESDAARWADVAAELRGAAVAAAGQVVPPSAFSFAGAEVAAAYEALRSRTATLLAQGADDVAAMAAALRAGAAAYAAAEAATAQRIAESGHRGPR